ncbi:MAG: translation initiation factor IF-6 [Thermoproteus sp. AZ2]|jgi:translation initiation factor 6|uniref:Translation initiation factor IF-6 n=1 Tax=Thermoproteus sp. AZ2 TaxID=1609232 RepID=A0ACC6V0A9_9CREN|nr:MAG: translation initiation factor 6 [Thermoproteus sp. AZ2]
MADVIPARVYGSSTVGIYIAANNALALVPPDVPEKIDDAVREALGVNTIVRATVAKSPLLGIFIVLNDNGALVPSIALEEEVKLLKGLGINVGVVNTRYTALANLIAANNKAALVSPLLEPENRRVVADVLGVEVFVDSVANTPLVGSIVVANSRGVLASPDVTDNDLKRLEKYFGGHADVGTVNRGRSFIRGGLVANDRGALVGYETTGAEIMRIMSTLFK